MRSGATSSGAGSARRRRRSRSWGRSRRQSSRRSRSRPPRRRSCPIPAILRPRVTEGSDRPGDASQGDAQRGDAPRGDASPAAEHPPEPDEHEHAVYEAAEFLGAPADEPIPEQEVSLTRRVLNWKTILSIVFAAVILALAFRTLGVN